MWNYNYLVFNPIRGLRRDTYYLSIQGLQASGFHNYRNGRGSWLCGQSPWILWVTGVASSAFWPRWLTDSSVKQELWRTCLPVLVNAGSPLSCIMLVPRGQHAVGWSKGRWCPVAAGHVNKLHGGFSVLTIFSGVEWGVAGADMSREESFHIIRHL